MFRSIPILLLALFTGVGSVCSDIVFTQKSDLTLGKGFGELMNVDLNQDGIIDFRLSADIVHFAGIQNKNQNRYLIHPDPPPNIGGGVVALNLGYLIESNSGEGALESWFGLNTDWAPLILTTSTGKSGQFYRHRGFIGLEFEANDGTHYGWLDIEGAYFSIEDLNLSETSLYIHGWAYETEPGKGIIAGAIPEPSSLCLFTIGGYAIWRARKRKKC